MGPLTSVRAGLARLRRRREPRDWLIWSPDHGPWGWWGPDCKGYTDKLGEAGRYTEAQARSIFEQTWPKGDAHSEPRHASTVAAKVDSEIARVRSELRGLAALKAELLLARRRP